MKRKTKLLVIGLYLLLPFSLFSCKKEEASEKIRAEFYLEGGSCQNNTEKITYLYNLGEREETYIADPNVLKKNDISRDGYTLKGWYQTKTIVGADVTYSNPWDFNQDKMTKDGVKLYAYWVRDVVYSYELYYKDGDTDVLLGSYAVEQGEHFDDYLNYANKRTGYTSLGYYDETGEEWDEAFTHPGGEIDKAVKVYTKYIPGDYGIVRSLSDLRKYKNKNIYLMNDLDLEGAAFNFGDYNKIFEGNGYTIRNFSINYNPKRDGLVSSLEDPSSAKNNLYIGLFGHLTNAKIRNVAFENVTLDVNTNNSLIQNIFIGTLCVNAVNSEIENVKFKGDFTINEKTLSKFTIEGVTDSLCYRKDTNTRIDDASAVEVTYKDNRNS